MPNYHSLTYLVVLWLRSRHNLPLFVYAMDPKTLLAKPKPCSDLHDDIALSSIWILEALLLHMLCWLGEGATMHDRTQVTYIFNKNN